MTSVGSVQRHTGFPFSVYENKIKYSRNIEYIFNSISTVGITRTVYLQPDVAFQCSQHVTTSSLGSHDKSV